MPEPATAEPTAVLIRSPTSLVPSPGRDTISRGPTRTASSGTALGTPPPTPGAESFTPWGSVPAGARRPSSSSWVTSKSGPRSSSEPVRNGMPTWDADATRPPSVSCPQKHTRVQRMSSAGVRESRRPARRQARTMAPASTRPT